MAEQHLIAQIHRMAKNLPGRLQVGIGDDCAVWRPRKGYDLLISTDQLVEGVHFRKAQLPATQAGARLMGRGLSDIAAMGGEPRLVFLSLALPKNAQERWTRKFVRGLVESARRYGVTLAGGDLTATSGPVTAAVTVIGEAPAGRALLRSGARPGDRLYVTGTLGRMPKIITPRLNEGRRLRRLATAAIDLSDGLSTDLHHLAAASRVGAVVIAARIPKAGSLKQALHRGEDYELLFTARPGVRVPGREIGYITRARRVMLEHPGGRREVLPASGWEHFSSGARRTSQTRL